MDDQTGLKLERHCVDSLPAACGYCADTGEGRNRSLVFVAGV